MQTPLPGGPWVPEISCLLGRELALPLQGLLLGQQLGPLRRQSLLLLQGPPESVHLGLLVPQALGQLLLQGLCLACGLEDGRGESSAERRWEGEQGLLREKDFRWRVSRRMTRRKRCRRVDVRHMDSQSARALHSRDRGEELLT